MISEVGMKSVKSAVAASIVAAVFLSGCAAPGVFSGPAYLDAIPVASPVVSTLPDGTYAGSARVAVPMGSIAAYPYANVEVTLSGGRYSSIALTSPERLGQDQRFVDFENRMIAAQSPAVDGVSGASFTSKALQLAVAAAVTQ
jgi:uncharacterized protein with FMN-binding domain